VISDFVSALIYLFPPQKARFEVRPGNVYIMWHCKKSTTDRSFIRGTVMKGLRVFFMMACISTLVSGALHATGSTTAFAFLRSDASARAAALAGSFTTITDDPNVVFYNPANLATINGTRGSIGFFKNLLDINSGSASFSTDVEGIGRFGAGIVYTNYGSFTEMDAVGNQIGTFGANDISLSVGYALSLQENLYVGGAAKIIYSGIAGYTSTAAAVDMGILYTIPDARVSLGASVRNLGAQLSTYNGLREQLPLDVAIGASVVPRGLPLLLNVGFHRLTDDVPTIAERLRFFTVGGEFTLSRVLQLRVGFDNAKRKDFKIGSSADLAGFSVGVGILVSAYKIDYALSSLGKAGTLHRVSVSTSF
jgi:hypothetical protein